MFDRDLGQWYRELFFPPQVSGPSGRQLLDDATLWGVSPADVADRPASEWFSGRKRQTRPRRQRTDLS